MESYTNYRTILCILLSMSFGQSFGTQFYTSPVGSNSGDGSIDNPWDLQTAFSHPIAIQAGDTLWLRGGIYSGYFTSELNGAQDEYIHVAQYPGEKAVIADFRQYASGATLQVNGSWTIYKDFEITNVNPNRTSLDADSFRPMGIQAEGHHLKFIQLIIHDVGHGIGFWETATDSEIYGCIIYYCGTTNIPGQFSTHGHGIYSQNNSGIKNIRDNFIFHQFGFGIHLYPNPSNLNGFHIDGNTLFRNGILSDDSIRFSNILCNPYPPYSCDNITIKKNRTYDNLSSFNYTSLYQTDVFLGATDVICGDLEVRENYFVGKARPGIAIVQWNGIEFTDNKTLYGSNSTVGLVVPVGSDFSDYLWDENTYYGLEGTNHFALNYGLPDTFGNWQANTGFDSSGEFINGIPSANEIFVEPSEYTPGRAGVTVYNWSLLENVIIPLSEVGLSDGQEFHILDISNIHGSPVYEGIYSLDSPEISVSLSNLSISSPVGIDAPETTAPEFACFLILPGEYINQIEEKPSTENSWEIFPNPSDGEINLLFRGTSKPKIRLELTDVSGKYIYNSAYFEAQGINPIPVEQLERGTYFLRIISSEQIDTIKFIVH